MRSFKNIYLVGPMGVGKTTVGKQLAHLFGFDFYDIDHEVENQTGAPISWIFEKEGEQGFRAREEKMTNFLCTKQNIVLATGGGVVLSDKNRKSLSENGLVIFITADVDVLVKRTSKDTRRPLLQDVDVKKKLTEIMSIRKPLYDSIADITVSSHKKSAKETAKHIYSMLNNM